MSRKHSWLSLASMVFVGVLLACLSAARAENDWVDGAAALIQRFEKVSTDPVPPLVRQEQYLELLDDVKKFSQAPGRDEREGKGRKAFGLLLSGRIHEQLGNGLAAVRCWQAHRAERDALPEADKAALGALFERAETAAQLEAPRICQVQARGNEVRVRAVDYPIEGVLAKLEEATSVPIRMIPVEGPLLERMEKALGNKLESQPRVSGLVDYVHEDWKRVDHSLRLLSGKVGLIETIASDRSHVRACIWDPLYLASLSERAAKCAAELTASRVETGIKTGYVILRGYYVRPPYEVTLRTEGGRVYVFLNGLPAGKGWELEESPPKEVQIPKLPETGQFANSGDLCRYAADMFLRDRKQMGLDAASEKLKAFLLKQDIVKDVRLQRNGSGFALSLKDGTRIVQELPSMSAGRTERAPRQTSSRKEYAEGQAEELKARVEHALKDDGLVLVSGDGNVAAWNGAEGRRRLQNICTSIAEAVRWNQELTVSLWGLADSRRCDEAWEIFLNLRHREVWDRLQLAPEE